MYRSCPGTSLPSCIDLVPAGQVVVVNTYIISIVYIISTIFDVRLCYFLCISMVIRHVIASESMVCDVYLCCCAYLWSVAARRWTTTWTSATRTEFTLTRLKPNVTYVSVCLSLCHSSQITRSSRIMFVYFHIQAKSFLQRMPKSLMMVCSSRPWLLVLGCLTGRLTSSWPHLRCDVGPEEGEY